MAQREIEQLWIFLSHDDKGHESILADQRNGKINAFLATSETALIRLRPAATTAAHSLGLSLTAVRFKREDSK